MRLGVRYRRARHAIASGRDARIADLETRARTGGALDAEDEEQLELLGVIRAAITRARGPVHLIDLHATSAHGVPLHPLRRHAEAAQVRRRDPLPLVIGLEEQLDGALSSYWTTQGCITCAVEGGQHDDTGSIDNLEGDVLLLGRRVGRAPRSRPPHRGRAPRTASSSVVAATSRASWRWSRATPSPTADAFVMEPGSSTSRVHRAGQLLARDRRGPIRAQYGGDGHPARSTKGRGPTDSSGDAR